MTEKRFKEVFSIETIIDTVTGVEHKPCMVTDELLCLMNELNDEVNLQQTVIKMKREQLDSLKAENEQLKQFIQSLAEQSVNGKVMLRDGKVYDLNKILKKGDVE